MDRNLFQSVASFGTEMYNNRLEREAAERKALLASLCLGADRKTNEPLPFSAGPTRAQIESLKPPKPVTNVYCSIIINEAAAAQRDADVLAEADEILVELVGLKRIESRCGRVRFWSGKGAPREITTASQIQTIVHYSLRRVVSLEVAAAVLSAAWTLEQ